MLHIGERFKTLPLIWSTLYKSFTFLVLLLILNAIEEVVVGLIHHRSVVDSISKIGGGTLDQLIATSFIVALVLAPFFAFRSLGEVVGERNLVRIFFTDRHDASAKHVYFALGDTRSASHGSLSTIHCTAYDRASRERLRRAQTASGVCKKRTSGADLRIQPNSTGLN
jgi:hypothetical protein